MNYSSYDENMVIENKSIAKKIVKKVLRIPFLIFMKPFVMHQNEVNKSIVDNINFLLEGNNALEQVLKRTESEFINTKEELANTKGELANTEGELANTKGELANTKEELANTKGELANTKEELANTKEELANTKGELANTKEELANTQEQLVYFKTCLDKNNLDIGALARQTMLAKWKIIDHVDNLPERLVCKICGSSHRIEEYEIKESECIFNGGKLVRYVCPDCGVIFGPTKFVNQGQKGIDEDYWVHYLGFNEGDSFYKEERAFYMLKPEKNKVYLNYGCGRWSKSLQKLREEGYNVYGYEPYAPEIDNPFMITSKDELEKMRFDGIYSNDVLEHLIDPVKEMKFMCSLLIDKNSKMSHCTSCYAYKYEYTRFHTHFFVGESVKKLAEKSGLYIIDHVDDLEKNDFICYVYAPMFVNNNVYGNLVGRMIELRNSIKQDNIVRIEEKGCICGPYISIPEGEYIFKLDVKGTLEDATIRITADMGKKVIIEKEKMRNKIEFKLNKFEKFVEIVIESGNSVLDISNIELIRN